MTQQPLGFPDLVDQDLGSVGRKILNTVLFEFLLAQRDVEGVELVDLPGVKVEHCVHSPLGFCSHLHAESEGLD